MQKRYGDDTDVGREVRDQIMADKQAEATKASRTNKKIAILCAVLCIVSIGVTIARKIDSENKVLSIQQEIARKQIDLDNLRNREDEYTIKYVDPDFDNVGKLCTGICDYQNKLSQYAWEEAVAGSNNISTEHISCLTDYREYLKKIGLGTDLDSNFFFVNSWISQPFYVIDTHNPMIQTKDRYRHLLMGEVEGDTCAYEWICDSDFTYVGYETCMAWICYDRYDVKRARPLIIVTARYNNNKKVFSDFNICSTDFARNIMMGNTLEDNDGETPDSSAAESRMPDSSLSDNSENPESFDSSESEVADSRGSADSKSDADSSKEDSSPDQEESNIDSDKDSSSEEDSSSKEPDYDFGDDEYSVDHGDTDSSDDAANE